MSLHLYTKSWDAPLERNAGNVDRISREKGRDLLADPGACGEAIARYEGAPIPAFARERPDIAGIKERLHLAEGKKHIVVIGNGMVGHRFVEKLIEYDAAKLFKIFYRTLTIFF